MIERKCILCQATFSAYPSVVKRGGGLLCSKLCRNRYGRSKLDQRGEKNPAWKGGNRHRIHSPAWNAKNPEKRRAHHAVEHEIKMGRMTRQPCESCGNERSDGHHDDYDRPLSVRWLCRRCHVAEHKK